MTTFSTGKYYTQRNASSFGTFPNDRLMLCDSLTEVTVGSGSTVMQTLFRKCVVMTTFRYRSKQHKRVSGNTYWLDPEGTGIELLVLWSRLDQSGSIRVTFTLHAGLNRFDLVRSRNLE